MTEIVTDTTQSIEWHETFDGILSKLEEIYKENLELKKELLILKTKKTRKPKTKKPCTTTKQE